MNPAREQCDCCYRCVPVAEMGGWIGSGTLAPVCASCFQLYSAVRVTMPDSLPQDALNIARFLRFEETLPRHLRPKLRRLIILLQNGSKRARRMLHMAENQGMSVQQTIALF